MIPVNKNTNKQTKLPVLHCQTMKVRNISWTDRDYPIPQLYSVKITFHCIINIQWQGISAVYSCHITGHVLRIWQGNFFLRCLF